MGKKTNDSRSFPWKSENPRFHELKVGGLDLLVHRHVRYEPDDWLLTISGIFNFGPYKLNRKEIEEAKSEAFTIAWSKVKVMDFAFKSLMQGGK